MSGRLTVIFMAFVLGVVPFGIAMLPLFFAKNHLAKLSALGTGLLLGTALGVIIPEGIEMVAGSSPQLPTSKIALSLLVGFAFMLVVEKLTAGHSNSPGHELSLPLNSVKTSISDVQFDADLDELEREPGIDSSSGYREVNQTEMNTDSRQRAFTLMLGLVTHGLADGFALGASALPGSESSEISLVVFFALLVHKVPTVLALTTTLLISSFPLSSCKKYVAIFSASTPVGAVLSYELFSFLGGGQGGWPGIALLVSGGTFLYVATVLQPVSQDPHLLYMDELGEKSRAACIVAGMFIPYVIGAFLGGHGHKGT